MTEKSAGEVAEGVEKDRILVVDDEPKIVDVIRSYLEHAGYGVVTAGTGREALRTFEEFHPSLIVLDLMLPDLSGEEVCRTLRRSSAVPVIMLTAKVEEEDILRGLKLGADDYVTKPFSPRQLVARVEAVLRRSGGGTVPVLSFGDGDLTIDTSRMEVRTKGNPVSLTPNEYKILSVLAKYPNKVFTREELIEAISDGDYDGFDRVIDTHIKNIRQKIESGEHRYILTVRGVGYRFGGK